MTDDERQNAGQGELVDAEALRRALEGESDRGEAPQHALALGALTLAAFRSKEVGAVLLLAACGGSEMASD